MKLGTILAKIIVVVVPIMLMILSCWLLYQEFLAR